MRANPAPTASGKEDAVRIYYKIRYMGIWASSKRKTKLVKSQTLLGPEVSRLTFNDESTQSIDK